MGGGMAQPCQGGDGAQAGLCDLRASVILDLRFEINSTLGDGAQDGLCDLRASVIPEF